MRRLMFVRTIASVAACRRFATLPRRVGATASHSAGHFRPIALARRIERPAAPVLVTRAFVDSKIDEYLALPDSPLNFGRWTEMCELIWYFKSAPRGTDSAVASNYSLVHRVFQTLCHRPLPCDAKLQTIADRKLCWGLLDVCRRFGPTYAAHGVHLMCTEFIARGDAVRTARCFAVPTVMSALTVLINTSIGSAELASDGLALHAMRDAASILHAWIERPDVRAELRILHSGASVSGAATIYDTVIQALATTKQFTPAVSVLEIVAAEQPQLLSAHYFRALVVGLCIPPHRNLLVRVTALYERAFAAAATNRMPQTYDSQLAIAMLYAYSFLEDLNRVSAIITHCRAREIVIHRSVHDTLARRYTNSHSAAIRSSGTADVFARVLTLCADRAALAIGRAVYAAASAGGEARPSASCVTAYLHLLMRANEIAEAEQLFQTLKHENAVDLVAYTAMISGYAMNRRTDAAFALFDELTRDTPLAPNGVTYLALLSACAHTGAVERADGVLVKMRACGEPLTAKHQNVYLDVLARSGKFDAAERHLLTEMSCSAAVNRLDAELERRRHATAARVTAFTLTRAEIESCCIPFASLLGAFCNRTDVDRAERMFNRFALLAEEHARTADSSSAGAATTGDFVATFALAHRLMANLYAAANRPADAARMTAALKQQRGLIHETPKSWIEVSTPNGDSAGSTVLEVFVGDARFLSYGRQLTARLKSAALLPPTIATDADDLYSCGHTEMLALAYGLAHTSMREPIRIVKNLRVCRNCHATTCAAAKLTGRHVFVRDATAAHHFTPDGSCSCHGFY